MSSKNRRLRHVGAAQGGKDERARRIKNTLSERATPADTGMRHKQHIQAGFIPAYWGCDE